MALGQIVDLLGTKFDNVSKLQQPQGRSHTIVNHWSCSPPYLGLNQSFLLRAVLVAVRLMLPIFHHGSSAGKLQYGSSIIA